METGLNTEERALSKKECLGLLASVSTGRLAGSHRALPAVMPVHFQLVEHMLAIEPLLAASFPFAVDSVVAFEAGTLGEGLLSEWVVEIRGFLRPINDANLRSPMVDHGGTDTYWLSPDVISGWSVEGGRAGRDTRKWKG